MYQIVNNPSYVASPNKGSNHNKGCAVDIGLADLTGKELDLGTKFDDFTEKAHYNCNFISESAKQYRTLLRNIMSESGFEPYEKEWWHFNFPNAKYEISNFEWSCNE
jgi:D-alanyl-D-alanine dipeptidase